MCDGIGRLSRNVGPKLRTVAAQHPSRLKPRPYRCESRKYRSVRIRSTNEPGHKESRHVAPLSQHSTAPHTDTHCIAGGHLCCRNWTLHAGSQFSVLATGSSQHLSPQISCLSPRCIGVRQASKTVHICHHLLRFLACKFYFTQLMIKWHGKFQTIPTTTTTTTTTITTTTTTFLSKCLAWP